MLDPRALEATRSRAGPQGTTLVPPLVPVPGPVCRALFMAAAIWPEPGPADAAARALLALLEPSSQTGAAERSGWAGGGAFSSLDGMPMAAHTAGMQQGVPLAAGAMGVVSGGVAEGLPSQVFCASSKHSVLAASQLGASSLVASGVVLSNTAPDPD